MTTYNTKKNADIKKGLFNEKKVLKLLSKEYKDIQGFEDKFSPVDFISHKHKVVVELKSTQQSDLKSYRFGSDKYTHFCKTYKKEGYTFMLLYFIKGTATYCMIEDPKQNHRIITWGRSDRGRQEVQKEYIIIEREDFKKYKRQFKNRPEILPLNHFKQVVFTMLVDED